jgi:hypothetical protein
MKQDSSILFHSMRNSLRNRYYRAACIAFVAFIPLLPTAGAAENPEYLASFNPARGFKPAQRDLTEIYLQLAGSLEAYGSPEPYLRHILAEHARIENLYRQRFGKDPTSYRPAYMTDAYVDRFAANWKLLSPKLGLEPFAKEVGNDMREAILGTRQTGTVVVDIFNRHQSAVFDAMAGKNAQGADFKSLKAELVNRLELDKTSINEKGYEIARRDAVSYAIIIHGITMRLFDKIDQSLNPDAAKAVKAVLTSAFLDAGVAADSELKAGIAEWAIAKPSTAGR